MLCAYCRLIGVVGGVRVGEEGVRCGVASSRGCFFVVVARIAAGMNFLLQILHLPPWFPWTNPHRFTFGFSNDPTQIPSTAALSHVSPDDKCLSVCPSVSLSVCLR